MFTSSRLIGLVALAATAALPAVVSAQAVNGFKINDRFYNDFTTSTLVITGGGSNPTTVNITETGYADDGVGGNFANRHDVLASSDGGANARTFSITEGFTASMTVNLATLQNSPRKEAGLRVNSPITGDALFIVNSDAGEIVAFGGGAPFKLFGNNANTNGYTPGTNLLMGMTYTPAGGSLTKGTLEYFIDRGGGIETSGPLTWDNLEGGPLTFNVGAYVQITPNLAPTAADGVSVSFTDLTVTVVPEPASLAALGVAAVALRRRRLG